VRTAVQRNRRKTFYRVVSVAFILIGVAHFFMDLKDGNHDLFQGKMDIALLWFVFGGTWVAISRLWGELADTSAASKQESGPAS
jgi:hypothetical protein